MLQDLQNTYTKLTYVHDDSYWAKYIYLTKTLPEPANYLDCSFVCRNVEKPNGCELFLMEVNTNIILILMFIKGCLEKPQNDTESHRMAQNFFGHDFQYSVVFTKINHRIF